MYKRARQFFWRVPHPLSCALLVVALFTSCATQPVDRSHAETDSVCFVPNYSPFGVLIPTLEPICLPADAPPPTPDEFLSFEEWKLLKIEESAMMHQDRVTDSNPSDPSAPELATDITTSTSDGNLPLPPLRVPLTDRFNYASSECSARVQSSHKSMKSPWAILNSKRDKYMLSPCAAKEKFVVVELCDDIQVDTILLANFEFFSGVFKDISISAAQTYDADRWQSLGTFRAKNIRTVQSFLLPRDSRFFRYIRIEFISHYGSEYYCPVSLMQVYGLTQIEEYKWDEWQAAWHREHEIDTKKVLPSGRNDLLAVLLSTERTIHSTPTASGSGAVSADPATVPSAESLGVSGSNTSKNGDREAGTPTPSCSLVTTTPTLDAIRETFIPPDTDYVEAIVDDIMRYTPEHEKPSSISASVASPETSQSASHCTSCQSSAEASTSPPSLSTSSSSRLDSQTTVHIGSAATTPAASFSPNHTSSLKAGSESMVTSINTTTRILSSTTPTSRPTVAAISVQNRPAGAASAGGSTAGSESIYRNIMNRLTTLESNSSLGVRYVEDQARYVREALKRLEQDVGRLETLSNQQQVLYRRTVLELQQHKRNTEAERSALLSQLEALSDEVLLEKRLGLAQLCLLLVVLVFMALTRSASLEISPRDTVSPSSGAIAGTKSGPGLWRFKRASAGPERLKLASELTIQPSQSTSSAGDTFQRRLGSITPIPRPSPIAGRQFMKVTSPVSSLGTPFVPRDAPPSARNKAPLEQFSQCSQSASHPNLTPSHLGGTPFRDELFHPGSARRALAKTAHLHEVGRRRRVSSPRSKQPLGTPESPGSPSRMRHLVSSHEGNESCRRDVFNTAQTPTGTPRRLNSRPRSRGASGLTRSPSASASPSAHLSHSSLRSTQALGHRKHAREMPESVSSSDLWEDTSDAGDADNEEAVAEALFNPKTHGQSEVLRSAENLPRPFPGHLRAQK